LKNAESSAEKLEKCSAQELFSAFGVSDQQGKAVSPRETTVHKHKGRWWLKKTQLIMESIKGQAKGNLAQGPLMKGSRGTSNNKWTKPRS